MENENNIPEYDKIILYLDKDNLTHVGVNSDFNIDLLEPIRNVVYIKTISSYVKMNTDTDMLDKPIYISLNSYNKSATITNIDKFLFFERFTITTGGIGNINNSSYFNPNDTSVYALNPQEPNFRKINIKLYDNNNSIIEITRIAKFNITLCIYSLKKKF